MTRWTRFRLWVKLAALAVAGVVVMHAVHLAIGNRLATRALTQEINVFGAAIARLVAEQVTDAVIVDDRLALHEIVGRTASGREGVDYCIVIRHGAPLASTFPDGTPPGLLAARSAGEREPIVIRLADGRRVLDVAEPILGGDAGVVRLGLRLDVISGTREQLARQLGTLAVAVIAAGIVAAVLFARSIAQPVGDLLSAADRFDPARPHAPVPISGSAEIAELVVRFNQMMERLRLAHGESERVRQKSMEAERLAALGSLVAGVAHEVNNPLAGLRNCLRRLEREDLPGHKRREYMALMDEGLSRIGGVVRRLLDLALPQPSAVTAVEASDLAREAARIVQPQLDERGVSCVVICDADDDGPVMADRRKLGQALLNLLLNAAYVTPDGGSVRVAVRRKTGAHGIAVADDGPGIPAEIRERVLDPFFTTKPAGDGTGLGLAVTRSIVDAQGGELSFEFPAQGGTVATIWLRDADPADRVVA